jgi:hypothetical protein
VLAEPGQRQAPADLLALVLNGTAAMVAIAAAFAAGRRRHRRNPVSRAQVLHLPTHSVQRRRAA